MSMFRLIFKSKLLFLRLGPSLKRDAVRPQLNVLEAAYNNRTKSNDDDDVPLVVDRYIVCNSSTIVDNLFVSKYKKIQLVRITTNRYTKCEIGNKSNQW